MLTKTNKQTELWLQIVGNIIHFMYGPEGESLFCFLKSPDVSPDEVEGNIQDSRENKTN